MPKPKSLDDYNEPITVWVHYGFNDQHINDCMDLAEEQDSDFWRNSAEFLGDMEKRPVDNITAKQTNWLNNIANGLEEARKM